MEIIDEQGRWLIENGTKMLIEPSENWIAQKEYEANLSSSAIQPKSEIELLQEKYNTLQGAIDFIIMNF